MFDCWHYVSILYNLSVVEFTALLNNSLLVYFV